MSQVASFRIAASSSRYKIVSCCRGPSRAHCAPCRAHIAQCRNAHTTVSSIVSQLYRDPKGHPQPRYKICIATHPLARPRTRAATGPCDMPVVSWPTLAVLWDHVVGSPSHVVAPYYTPQHPVSRYNPLYRYSDWKMGSSPFQLLPLLQFFFSLIFFSFCSTY